MIDTGTIRVDPNVVEVGYGFYKKNSSSVNKREFTYPGIW